MRRDLGIIGQTQIGVKKHCQSNWLEEDLFSNLLAVIYRLREVKQYNVDLGFRCCCSKLQTLESDLNQSLRVNFNNNGMGDPEVLMIFTRAPATSFAIQSMIDTMIKNAHKGGSLVQILGRQVNPKLNRNFSKPSEITGVRSLQKTMTKPITALFKKIGTQDTPLKMKMCTIMFLQ